MKNLILGVLLAGGMMFAATESAEASGGRRRVRRSHYSHYTPVYRSHGYGHYSPRSYYGYGVHSSSYYGGYNSHSQVNYGHGGWGFSIH